MKRRNKKKQAAEAVNTEPPQMGFIPILPKETPLKTGKLPQIFRRLAAIGFTQRSDGGYVNSNAEANIQTITWGQDKIEDGCAWLFVTAREPFAYITEASKRFARRRQPELTRRLQLTKGYWLQRVQPYIKGRALRGVELYVATDAYSRLRKAYGNAELWNQTEHGQLAPVPAEAFPDWSRDEFREPEELCRDEKLTPELLAAIAAPMMRERAADLPPLAVVGVAHDLLRAARLYVNGLPEQKRGIDGIVDDFRAAYNTVTFAEIEASNKPTSGQLPLLPPEGRKQEAETDPKQKAKPERKLGGQPLSRAAIKAAVVRFIYGPKRRRTKEEYRAEEKEKEPNPAIAELMADQRWESDNADLFDCKRNERVSVLQLCQLRWERFAGIREIRQHAALKREQKRREERQEEHPSSAASSLKTAGKLEKRRK